MTEAVLLRIRCEGQCGFVLYVIPIPSLINAAHGAHQLQTAKARSVFDTLFALYVSLIADPQPERIRVSKPIYDEDEELPPYLICIVCAPCHDTSHRSATRLSSGVEV